MVEAERKSIKRQQTFRRQIEDYLAGESLVVTPDCEISVCAADHQPVIDHVASVRNLVVQPSE